MMTVRHAKSVAICLLFAFIHFAGCQSTSTGVVEDKPASSVAEESEPTTTTTTGAGGEPSDESVDGAPTQVAETPPQPPPQAVIVVGPAREGLMQTDIVPDEYGPPEVSMQIVESRRNDITDTHDWLARHPIGETGEKPSDAPSQACGEQFRKATRGDAPVALYGNAHSPRCLWTPGPDGRDVLMDLSNLRGESMSLTHAIRYEDMVFVSHSSRMSAEAMNGENGYLTALDARTGDVVWGSNSLVANSMNFQYRDGVLFSGYGFTREDDFLYAIDAKTGRTIERLPVPKMIDYLTFEEGTLFVRTYDRDLRVEVEIRAQAP
jgi:hypothetical protein